MYSCVLRSLPQRYQQSLQSFWIQSLVVGILLSRIVSTMSIWILQSKPKSKQFGLILVAQLRLLLYTNQARGRRHVYIVWSLAIQTYKQSSIIWFRALLWLFVQRQQVVDKHLFIIWTLHTSCQKSNVIQESLLDTMLFGISNRHLTCSKNNLAKSTIVVFSQVGKNKVYFVIQYTIIRMLLYTCLFLIKVGNLVI